GDRGRRHDRSGRSGRRATGGVPRRALAAGGGATAAAGSARATARSTARRVEVGRAEDAVTVVAGADVLRHDVDAAAGRAAHEDAGLAEIVRPNVDEREARAGLRGLTARVEPTDLGTVSADHRSGPLERLRAELDLCILDGVAVEVRDLLDAEGLVAALRDAAQDLAGGEVHGLRERVRQLREVVPLDRLIRVDGVRLDRRMADRSRAIDVTAAVRVRRQLDADVGQELDVCLAVLVGVDLNGLVARGHRDRVAEDVVAGVGALLRDLREHIPVVVGARSE